MLMIESNENPDYTPDGWHSVTPRIFVRDTDGFVAFLKRVFEAKGEHQSDHPLEMRIGDSMIMVSGLEARAPMAACLYVYVSDSDAVYQRALESGATSIEAPFDTPYGDRRGMVEDRWGNIWQIATRIVNRNDL